MKVSEFMDPELLDGTMKEDVSFREVRNIAAYVPEWNADKCIQCGQCAFACPHATIRPFLMTPEECA